MLKKGNYDILNKNYPKLSPQPNFTPISPEYQLNINHEIK